MSAFPSFVSVGTAGTAGSGNVTPAAPASIIAGDILVLCGHSRDNVAWSVDNGYTSKITGNAGVNSRLELWWKRTTGSEGTTTVTHTAGNSITIRIFAYRNCIRDVDPFNVIGSVQTNAGSPISTTAITTTISGCLILHLYGSQDDNTWSTFTGAATNNRGNATDTAGTDGSMGLADGEQPNAGSSGTAAATQATLGPDAGASVLAALMPFGTYQNNYQFARVGTGFWTTDRIR